MEFNSCLHDGMHTPDADFGARLRKARRDQGISQTEASTGIVTASFLSLIESGKRMPSPAVAAALAQRLGIDVDAQEARPDTANPLFIAALAAVRAGDAEGAQSRAEQLPGAWPGRALVEGLVAEHRGQLTAATRLLRQALQAATPGSELWFEVSAALCRTAFNAGDVVLAIEAGEAALAITDLPTPHSEDLAIGIRASLSGVYCDSGNLARARELADDPTVRPSTPWQRGMQLWARSILAVVDGRPDRAELLASEALRMFREADRPISLARLQVNAAMLKLPAPGFDADAVGELLGAAEDTFRSLNSPFDLAGCLTTRARLDARRGNHAEARTAIEEALLLVRDEGVGMRARIYASAGQTFLTIGDRANADVHLLEARHLLEGAGANRAAAATWRALASAYEEAGTLDLALACMKAATDLLGVHAQATAPAHAAL